MSFLNLVGNDLIQKQIKIAIVAAKQRNGAIPHMLLSGVPGCGKTSTAQAIATITNAKCIQIPPEELKTYQKIMDALSELNCSGYSPRGDKIKEVTPSIVFIDEIHRLPILGQEKLGIIMETFRIESDKDKGQHIWFPLFTVIGATTEEGLLSKPFRERFKSNFQFKAYELQEIEQIIAKKAEKLGILITKKAITVAAKRSRGIPRIAVNYLDLLYDRQLAYNSNIITSALVADMFEDKGIDEEGLTEKEREILLILYEAKVPIGLSNLAAMTDCSQVTLSDSSEPFLLRKGLIARSNRGRIITQKGINYIKKLSPEKLTKINIGEKEARIL